MSALTRSFGGIPTTIETGEVYDALSKKITEGGVYGLEPVLSRRWGDFMKYHTLYNFGGRCWFLAMNKNSYAKLPDDLKKIMDETTGVVLAEKYGV